MDFISGLIQGFATLLSASNLVACIAGTIIGALAGMFFGISAAATIVLLFTISLDTIIFSLPAAGAIIFLISIAYGVMQGQAIACFCRPLGSQSDINTSILLLILASLLGGAATAIIIAASAAQISHIALLLGPADYAGLMIFVLIVPAVIIPGSIIRTISVIALGLLLSSVGTDLETGSQRFSFGVPELSDGIGLVPLAIGVLVIAEIIRGLNPSEVQGVGASPSVAHAGALGFLSGLIGTDRQIFASHASGEHGLAPDQPEHSVGRETRNAANVAGGYFGLTACFVPALFLGLSTSAAAVLFVRILPIFGFVPGPEVMTKQPQLFWSVFSTIILVCTVAPLSIVPAAFFRWSRIDFRIIAPLLMVWSCFCAYSFNNSAFDIGLTILFGVVGYVMIRFELDRGLFLIAFIMGPALEENFRRTFLITRGDPFVFIQRPIAATFLIATVILVISGAIWRLYSRRNAVLKAQQPA